MSTLVQPLRTIRTQIPRGSIGCRGRVSTGGWWPRWDGVDYGWARGHDRRLESEADPADLAHWTDGRVLVATGSPYPPLEIDGRQVPVAQCNNVFIFPAVGRGVVVSRARRVTDRMMQAAARALGELSPAAGNPHASLLPPIDELRAAAVNIATAVAITAVDEGVAPSAGEAQLRARVTASQWTPAYA